MMLKAQVRLFSWTLACGKHAIQGVQGVCPLSIEFEKILLTIQNKIMHKNYIIWAVFTRGTIAQGE